MIYLLQWNPYNFILGCSFLSFILITRFLVCSRTQFQISIFLSSSLCVCLLQGKKNRKLFWLPAIAPLISVILSTVIVFLTRADKHGVKIVKHINGGLNPSSINELQISSPNVGELAKIGLILAVIALTVSVEFANFGLKQSKHFLIVQCYKGSNCGGTISCVDERIPS